MMTAIPSLPLLLMSSFLLSGGGDAQFFFRDQAPVRPGYNQQVSYYNNNAHRNQPINRTTSVGTTAYNFGNKKNFRNTQTKHINNWFMPDMPDMEKIRHVYFPTPKCRFDQVHDGFDCTVNYMYPSSISLLSSEGRGYCSGFDTANFYSDEHGMDCDLRYDAKPVYVDTRVSYLNSYLQDIRITNANVVNLCVTAGYSFTLSNIANLRITQQDVIQPSFNFFRSTSMELHGDNVTINHLIGRWDDVQLNDSSINMIAIRSPVSNFAAINTSITNIYHLNVRRPDISNIHLDIIAVKIEDSNVGIITHLETEKMVIMTRTTIDNIQESSMRIPAPLHFIDCHLKTISKTAINTFSSHKIGWKSPDHNDTYLEQDDPSRKSLVLSMWSSSQIAMKNIRLTNTIIEKLGVDGIIGDSLTNIILRNVTILDCDIPCIAVKAKENIKVNGRVIINGEFFSDVPLKYIRMYGNNPVVTLDRYNINSSFPGCQSTMTKEGNSLNCDLSSVSNMATEILPMLPINRLLTVNNALNLDIFLDCTYQVILNKVHASVFPSHGFVETRYCLNSVYLYLQDSILETVVVQPKTVIYATNSDIKMLYGKSGGVILNMKNTLVRHMKHVFLDSGHPCSWQRSSFGEISSLTVNAYLTVENSTINKIGDIIVKKDLVLYNTTIASISGKIIVEEGVWLTLNLFQISDETFGIIILKKNAKLIIQSKLKDGFFPKVSALSYDQVTHKEINGKDGFWLPNFVSLNLPSTSYHIATNETLYHATENYCRRKNAVINCDYTFISNGRVHQTHINLFNKASKVHFENARYFEMKPFRYTRLLELYNITSLEALPVKTCHEARIVNSNIHHLNISVSRVQINHTRVELLELSSPRLTEINNSTIERFYLDSRLLRIEGSTIRDIYRCRIKSIGTIDNTTIATIKSLSIYVPPQQVLIFENLVIDSIENEGLIVDGSIFMYNVHIKAAASNAILLGKHTIKAVFENVKIDEGPKDFLVDSRKSGFVVSNLTINGDSYENMGHSLYMVPKAPVNNTTTIENLTTKHHTSYIILTSTLVPTTTTHITTMMPTTKYIFNTTIPNRWHTSTYTTTIVKPVNITTATMTMLTTVYKTAAASITSRYFPLTRPNTMTVRTRIYRPSMTTLRYTYNPSTKISTTKHTVAIIENSSNSSTHISSHTSGNESNFSNATEERTTSPSINFDGNISIATESYLNDTIDDSQMSDYGVDESNNSIPLHNSSSLINSINVYHSLISTKSIESQRNLSDDDFPIATVLILTVTAILTLLMLTFIVVNVARYYKRVRRVTTRNVIPLESIDVRPIYTARENIPSTISLDSIPGVVSSDGEIMEQPLYDEIEEYSPESASTVAYSQMDSVSLNDDKGNKDQNGLPTIGATESDDESSTTNSAEEQNEMSDGISSIGFAGKVIYKRFK